MTTAVQRSEPSPVTGGRCTVCVNDSSFPLRLRELIAIGCDEVGSDATQPKGGIIVINIPSKNKPVQMNTVWPNSNSGVYKASTFGNALQYYIFFIIIVTFFLNAFFVALSLNRVHFCLLVFKELEAKIPCFCGENYYIKLCSQSNKQPNQSNV